MRLWFSFSLFWIFIQSINTYRDDLFEDYAIYVTVSTINTLHSLDMIGYRIVTINAVTKELN